ncbi:FtsW/RodA/SpoVE family cell cycle protein, partial [Pseudoxanthomonas sacheonensis]|uniref:FtsW/RodA/SpoVE family cell cycle protein n=1 Tax=Pseudoxanthomonas sacheonensis TaxID=443615 RepID=UPI0013D46F96
MSEILRWLADLVRYFLRTLDWPLLLALSVLMGIGLAVLYSAGGDAQGMRLMLAQGARFVVGLAAMWGLSRVTPSRLRAWTPGVFLISLLPLILVLFIGSGKHGNHWIDLKLFYFQPSELMKLCLPMMMAWYLHREPLPPRIRTVLAAGVLIGVPTGLILLQPDFGTGMLVAASGVFALLLAGLPWWWVGVAVGGARLFTAPLFTLAWGVVCEPGAGGMWLGRNVVSCDSEGAVDTG